MMLKYVCVSIIKLSLSCRTYNDIQWSVWGGGGGGMSLLNWSTCCKLVLDKKCVITSRSQQIY